MLLVLGLDVLLEVAGVRPWVECAGSWLHDSARLLNGRRWRSIDRIDAHDSSVILISETSVVVFKPKVHLTGLNFSVGQSIACIVSSSCRWRYLSVSGVMVELEVDNVGS